jgi:dTDP-4-amino-4,6-dideoxygalactose transaminase
MIPFTRPYLCGKEQSYIARALESGKFSGNGLFTAQCNDFFKTHFGIDHALLTTSCTDALEMTALLCNIQPGDEIIVPSYTYVSTANAFALHGAVIRFADSCSDHPNMDPIHTETLINNKTKAIVVMHYAGMACDMNAFRGLAKKHGLILIEDAAQCYDARFNEEVLGTLGDYGTYSFHETKNVICGEGGLLIIRENMESEQAEMIWEKGTDRVAFLKGKVQSYGWKSIGSSYYPSEITAAFLLAQLEHTQEALLHRKALWNTYANHLEKIDVKHCFELPKIEKYMQHNAHHFFMVFPEKIKRDAFLSFMKSKSIQCTFHYMPLHQSEFAQSKFGQQISLPHAEKFGNGLVRLPLYNNMTIDDVNTVCKAIQDYCKN